MAFDNIHNYFEKLVLEEINGKIAKDEFEDMENFIEDVACVALNQLPARYVRHNVDMVFYMTADEREHNEIQARNAVNMAVDYVEKHRHSDHRS